MTSDKTRHSTHSSRRIYDGSGVYSDMTNDVRLARSIASQPFRVAVFEQREIESVSIDGCPAERMIHHSTGF